MGTYEDFFWEIHDELNQLGLKKEFDAQLEKMKHQEEFKYKELKVRWEYALQVVKEENDKKVKIKR